MNLIKRLNLFLLYHQRKYDKVLAFTNFKIQKDIDKIDNIALRYQGLCSFYKDNFYHSKMCFEILLEKNTANSNDLYLLAYIYSRHNEKEKAISTWCKSLEINRNHKRSKKTLEYIRKNAREINFSEDDYFEKNLPKEPFLFPLFLIIKVVIIIIALILLVYLSYIGINYLIKQNKTIKTRTELNKVYLPDYNPNLLEKPKEDNLKYSYTENEIKTKFDKTKQLIFDNKVVEAQILINQIKHSNASGIVKTKMDLLESFIIQPDYALFKNIITFNDFIKEKSLYNNIYVVWNGRIVNLSIFKDRIAFDFVIGDENNGTIDAIIPVVFKKAIIVNNNDKVKVFGRIKVEKDDTYINGYYIIKEKK